MMSTHRIFMRALVCSLFFVKMSGMEQANYDYINDPEKLWRLYKEHGIKKLRYTEENLVLHTRGNEDCQSCYIYESYPKTASIMVKFFDCWHVVSTMPWDDWVRYCEVYKRTGQFGEPYHALSKNNSMFVIVMLSKDNDTLYDLTLCQVKPYQILKVVKQYSLDELKRMDSVFLRDLVVIVRYKGGACTRLAPYDPPYFELRPEKITRGCDMVFRFR